MARIKIDYGIDLGTTNSAICRMEKGKSIIIKTDTQKDTMPSCVSISRKKAIQVGETAFNNLKTDKLKAFKSRKIGASNAYLEFKRTMGTDTIYDSSNMGRSLSSEELSAEVLKTLKSFVLDEQFNSVVITVPAKFTVGQKTATIEAAKLAGFAKCELLQEPIAAAMAYGLDSESKDGIWLVFDFGGGTFDAALLKVEEGIMRVFDTEGDNYLGGKNLDYAIVDNILIPYLENNYELSSTLSDSTTKELLRDAMKFFAEMAKNQLSFKESTDIISDLGELGEDDEGEEIELDLTISQGEFFEVMRPYIQKAVDICKEIIKRNNLSNNQIDKLILVGGPTHSPLIRQMLKEQITQNVDTSIDPMTAVATGAALYASTIDAEVCQEKIDENIINLKVDYESTSVETTEFVAIQLLSESSLDKVFVEFERNDKAWASGKKELSKQSGEVIDVVLLESKPNSFSIITYDEKGNRIPCFPNEITIIQGAKVGAAPLPYNIGIATWSEIKKYPVFKMARGLEKNKPIPATGVINGLKTTSQLRPGVENDVLKIPIYQTDDFENAEGRRASLYEYVGDVLITGDEIASPLPKDSSVDIIIKTDTSEQMTLEVHFLDTDETIEKKLDTSKKQSVEEAKVFVEKELNAAQRSINSLKKMGINVDYLQTDLEFVKKEAENSSESKMVMQHLKEVMRKIDNCNGENEWDCLEKELKKEFERLEMAQKDLGDDESNQQVELLRKQTDQVIRLKDVNVGKETLEQIEQLFFKLTLIYQLIGFIEHKNNNFNSIKWSDVTRARQLVNKGLDIINNNPSVNDLRNIVSELLKLMPDEDVEGADGLLG